MIVQVGKKYRTLSGRLVTIHEIRKETYDGKKSTFPVKGTIDFSDLNGKKKKGSKMFNIWTINGRYDVLKHTKFDLIEVKE